MSTSSPFVHRLSLPAPEIWMSVILLFLAYQLAEVPRGQGHRHAWTGVVLATLDMPAAEQTPVRNPRDPDVRLAARVVGPDASLGLDPIGAPRVLDVHPGDPFADPRQVPQRVRGAQCEHDRASAHRPRS